MARTRLSMRKIREALRLKAGGLSYRAIARACLIGKETVREYLGRAAEAGLTWPLPEGLSEEDLERRLFPHEPVSLRKEMEPDWALVHRELRKKGVTRQLLWEEYRVGTSQGYHYSQFCERYRWWKKVLTPVLRMEHKAGEKMFVDYAGPTIPYTDRETGEARKAAVFVAALGASSMTYAEAQTSQELMNWIGGHVRAFEHFMGVTEAIVPDNTKSGVTSACFYEPELNPTYQALAEYYDTAVLPTRVQSPKHKAKVETAVKVVETLMARLRKRQFFSLQEINDALRPLLDDLNDRVMEHLGKSRRQLFEELDRPALRPLPAEPVEMAEWARARVNIDYHVAFAKHNYSVPYRYIHKKVEVRATERTVEIFYKAERIASHVRDDTPYHYTTLPEHRPESHRAYLEWNPERFVRWAERAGPFTAEMVRRIMASRPHPEQGYRASLGLMRLGTRYGNERLEAACERALAFDLISFRGVRNILEAGFDRLKAEKTSARPEKTHANLRGPRYYS
ncbi:MAG: IS21 family transposase [Candidatus Aminicenantes bacterium]|nr:IS21 family transposase [Candidatus Aminicenantes bacterium]